MSNYLGLWSWLDQCLFGYRLVTLAAFFSILSIFCRTFVPWFLKLMIGLSSQVIHYLPNDPWAAIISLLDCFTEIFADSWTLSVGSCCFLLACCLGLSHFLFLISSSDFTLYILFAISCLFSLLFLILSSTFFSQAVWTVCWARPKYSSMDDFTQISHCIW